MAVAAVSVIRTIFHLFAAVHFWYAVYFDTYYVIFPSTLSQPTCCGKWKFLTYWDAIIQSIFFTICVLNDFIGTADVIPRKPSNIRKLKDFFHASIGFPLATFVASTFWGLYAVDRELVFPKVLDAHFPVWLNHVMHTNVLVFSLIELVTSFRVYPSKMRGILALTTLMLVYLVWTFVIYFKTDRWVYPVMEVLNWPQRILFMLVLLGYAEALYFFGHYLNNYVWSREQKLISKKGSKRKEH